MRWTRASILAAAALSIAAPAFLLGRVTALWPAAAKPCPELDQLDPELVALDEGTLERRYLEGNLLPPSHAKRQLASIRATADVYVPGRRACMARVALVHAVASQETMAGTMPELWGLQRPAEELRALYLEIPLRTELTTDDRLDLVAQIEENFLPSLAAESEGDTDHWRRRYYGLLVLCDATDAALEQQRAKRPRDCLHLHPRPAKHDPAPPPEISPRPADRGDRVIDTRF